MIGSGRPTAARSVWWSGKRPPPTSWPASPRRSWTPTRPPTSTCPCRPAPTSASARCGSRSGWRIRRRGTTPSSAGATWSCSTASSSPGPDRPGRRGSAAAAGEDQHNRDLRRRLDRPVQEQACVAQAVEVGGQRAVVRTYPDPDAVGVVADGPPPALIRVPPLWRPARQTPGVAGEARVHQGGHEPPARAQDVGDARQGGLVIPDVHQRHLADGSVERAAVPPGAGIGEVANGVPNTQGIGHLRRLRQGHQAPRHVHAEDSCPLARQRAGDPTLSARGIEHAGPGQPAGDQPRRLLEDESGVLADPCHVPVRDLVVGSLVGGDVARHPSSTTTEAAGGQRVPGASSPALAPAVQGWRGRSTAVLYVNLDQARARPTIAPASPAATVRSSERRRTVSSAAPAASQTGPGDEPWSDPSSVAAASTANRGAGSRSTMFASGPRGGGSTATDTARLPTVIAATAATSATRLMLARPPRPP